MRGHGLSLTVWPFWFFFRCLCHLSTSTMPMQTGPPFSVFLRATSVQWRAAVCGVNSSSSIIFKLPFFFHFRQLHFIFVSGSRTLSDLTATGSTKMPDRSPRLVWIDAMTDSIKYLSCIDICTHINLLSFKVFQSQFLFNFGYFSAYTIILNLSVSVSALSVLVSAVLFQFLLFSFNFQCSVSVSVLHFSPRHNSAYKKRPKPFSFSFCCLVPVSTA
jgi:hypothetical protein